MKQSPNAEVRMSKYRQQMILARASIRMSLASNKAGR